jgi:hypothetical protein
MPLGLPVLFLLTSLTALASPIEVPEADVKIPEADINFPETDLNGKTHPTLSFQSEPPFPFHH